MSMSLVERWGLRCELLEQAAMSRRGQSGFPTEVALQLHMQLAAAVVQRNRVAAVQLRSVANLPAGEFAFSVR